MSEPVPIDTGRNDRTVRIAVVGVGGHGVVLCARLMAETAVLSGTQVAMSEVHGMAQRGGVVATTVVLNGGNCPMLPDGSADLLLATEPLEALRALHLTGPRGTLAVWMVENPPASMSPDDRPYPSRESIIEGLLSSGASLWTLNGRSEHHTPVGLLRSNVALLGTAVRSGVLPFELESFARTIKRVLPARFIETNLASLHFGHDKAIHVESPALRNYGKAVQGR
ncbi:MAG: 2-oxoacid:acceptor oxidoreductase family protein [Deltaproteobacteria bacterium]|nr:2-oxoacid:acceptor oxidoreductase family protein [Deltaproteobacteria bacterium]